MRIAIDEGRRLIEASMVALGHTPAEAAIIADHLVDCELRGLGYAGLARAEAIVEYIRRHDPPRGPITVLRDMPSSCHLDGANNVGYLVARECTEIAIAKHA